MNVLGFNYRSIFPVRTKHAHTILVLGLLTLPAGAQTTHHAPETTEVTKWRSTLLAQPSAKTGCSESVFPSTTWTGVSCGNPTPALKIAPQITGRLRPLDDENTTGDYALLSPTAISSASGSLSRVENVTNVVGFGSSQNQFNLQINTEKTFSPTAAGSICNRVAGCNGWLQFVLDSGGSINIQSWALGYGPTCPKALELHDPTTNSCGTRSASFTLPKPLLTVPQLAGAVLTGQVFKDAAGNPVDEVSLTVNGHAYKSNASPDVVGASGNWKTVEFNIFGNSNRDESVFNSGSLLSVQLSVSNGTLQPVTCNGPGAGDTGETTNLTLVKPCRRRRHQF